MSEKIEIVVRSEATNQPSVSKPVSHQDQFKLLNSDYDKAKAAGATKKVSNSETEVTALKREIEELLAIAEPTSKQLELLRKKLNEYAAINEKLGKVMGPISKQTDEYIKQEEKLQQARARANQKIIEAQSLLSKKSDGGLGLKNSIIEDEIRRNNVTYAKGSHTGQTVSVKKFMEMGSQGNFEKTQNPEEAKKLYELLLAKQTQAKTDIEEGNSELTKIDSDLAELSAKKVTVNSGEEIILNARAVKFENEKISTGKTLIDTDPGTNPEPGTPIKPLGQNKEHQGGLGKAIKQLTLYNLILKGVKKALNAAVQTVKELDKSLTEQAMVTGKTRKETYALVGSYQDLARQCGATTKEIASVATEYMKQGKTIQDSLTLTKAAVSAAKVARVNVGDSVNYLTTALNGFRLSAEDAMRVSDKFAAVAASSATDYDELAIALSKVASQANLAGMSIDYTTALLTKGLETTREAPETMGTALKTIIARMRELSDYGETLEDGIDINNVESQLSYVGIALRDASGELRSTEDVLDELGKKWDTLGKNQQAAVAKALAGTRQQSRLIAMMEDYERVSELQEIAQRSAGATSAQAAIYMEGMEAAMNRISVAWEKVIMSFSDSEIIIDVLEVVEKGLDFIGDFIGTEEGMVVALALVGTAIVNIVGARAKEYNLQKKQYKLQQEMVRAEIEREREAAKEKFKENPEEQIKNEKDKEALAAKDAEIAEEQKKYEEQVKLVEAAKAEKLKAEQELALEVEELKKLEHEAELLRIKKEDEDKNRAHLNELIRIQKEAMERKKAADENADVSQEEAEIKKLTGERNSSRGRSGDITKKQKTNAEKQKKQNEKIAASQEKVANATNKVTQAQADQQASVDRLNKLGNERNGILDNAFLKTEANLKINEKLAATQDHLNVISSIYQTIMAGISMVTGVVNIITTIATGIKLIYTAATITETGTEKASAKAKLQAAAAQMGLNGAMYACPIVWIIAAFIAAIAVIALITVGVIALVKAFIANNDESAKAADNIKKLSGEIYNCQKRADELRSSLDVFDELDDKVIKTKEDMEAMNAEMDKLAESMSTEEIKDADSKDATEYDKRVGALTKGKTEKEYYDSLTSDKAKREFAEKLANTYEDIADEKRQEQIKELQGISTSNQRKLLENDIEVADAVYSINNDSLYDTIDALETKIGLDEEERKSLESMTQSVLENMDAWDAWQMAQDPEAVKRLTEALSDVNLEGTNDLAANVLQDDNAALTDRVKAYRQIQDALKDNTAAYNSFNESFKEWEFWDGLTDKAITTLDSLKLTNDEINKVYNSYKTLNDLGVDIDRETFQSKLNIMWEDLDEDASNFEQVLRNSFGEAVGDNEEAWNALVASIGDTISTSILDMGQQMEKFGNTINGFYEKASNWKEMSESEKMEFISDNAELFKGEHGDGLLKAFESGNYAEIEEKLAQQMSEQTSQQLSEVRKTLAVELAKTGDARNEAYIKSLQDYEAYLLDTNNLYKASLELRLEQEQSQLDEYRSYLQEEQKALQKSLEDRKAAYEKYFDDIAQEEEDADYEEEANMLISNLGKLSSSTNASSVQQTKQLENKLQELEEQRLKDLRERAQEAVLENMDTELEEINDKFDELLENNRALLAAMQGDLKDPTKFIGELISNKIENGATATEVEDYIKTLEGTYSSVLGDDVNWDNIKVREENNQMFLTVNGQEIALDSGNEQNLYAAIMKALREVGVR